MSVIPTGIESGSGQRELFEQPGIQYSHGEADQLIAKEEPPRWLCSVYSIKHSKSECIASYYVEAEIFGVPFHHVTAATIAIFIAIAI